MGRKKAENTIRAGTKDQVDEILAEQENLIKKVGGETESEDVIKNRARSNMVGEVIDVYAHRKNGKDEDKCCRIDGHDRGHCRQHQ